MGHRKNKRETSICFEPRAFKSTPDTDAGDAQAAVTTGKHQTPASEKEEKSQIRVLSFIREKKKRRNTVSRGEKSKVRMEVNEIRNRNNTRHQ